MSLAFRNLLWSVLLLCVSGCGGYRPTFSSVDVTCTSSSSASATGSSSPSGDGTWIFSSWAEDGDGTDDIAQVMVAVQDFAGATIKTLPLTHAQDNFWSDTVTEDEIGLECAQKDLYLFTFQATDSAGETATMDYVP